VHFVYAHVMGIPVEETILMFAPVGLALTAALRFKFQRLLPTWRRRWSSTRSVSRVGERSSDGQRLRT
jgi:hypothetical protein